MSKLLFAKYAAKNLEPTNSIGAKWLRLLDALDLTPATVVKMPGVASGTRNPDEKLAAAVVVQPPRANVAGAKTQTVAHAHAAVLTAGASARLPGSNARYRARTPEEPPVADPTARRMLEGPMFVRMAELRNTELAEARAIRAASTNGGEKVIGQ